MRELSLITKHVKITKCISINVSMKRALQVPGAQPVIEELNRMAVPADGEFEKEFERLAAELDMAIAITILEKHDPMPGNMVVLFDRYGTRQYTYVKIRV